MDSALQLISSRVVVGYPEQRLSDLERNISSCAAQYCAVLDGRDGELMGLIRFSAVAAHPSLSQRILSDLMAEPPRQVLPESAPVESVDRIMAEQGLQEITVTSASGAYRGLITPERFTAWHLAQERRMKNQLSELLAEQSRLADFLEKRVNARMDEIRSTLSAFETMCLTLSHDIHAPLRSVRGHAQLLLEDHGKFLWPEARALVARIAEIAAKGTMLADDVLGTARKSFGERAQSIAAVDLNIVFSDALEFLAALIRERHAQIATSGTLHSVAGYYVPLLQIFINLIGNAIKHVPPGRRPLVTVWTDRTETAVIINIKDNGDGIGDRELNRLLQPFSEVGKRPGVGHGMGLSIVQNAANEMKGSVTAVRHPEGGTLFTVTLPAHGDPPPVSTELGTDSLFAA